MTPTEQDKELRLEIARKVYPKPTPSEIRQWRSPEAVLDKVYSEAPIVYKFANYITADRKRVALEARLDENEEWRLFSKEAQRGILPTDFKARMITLKEPYQLSEAQQEAA